MAIIKKQGYIGNHIYLIDTIQFNAAQITTAFIYWDGSKGLILDCGTSDNLQTIFEFCEQNNIDKKRLIGITGTHYHFDHMGGAAKIWQLMTQHNPDFKIIVAEDMMTRLQNAEPHIKGAKTTFGSFVGTMNPVSEQAYMLVEKNQLLNLDLNLEMKLVSTPGHTPDHCSPTFYRDNEAVFTFAGEAAGCMYHRTELISGPTSMPPNFNFELYMRSLQKLKALKPSAIGFCHFGIIKGREDVSSYLERHEKDLILFRELVIEAYNEKNSIKHILERTNDFLRKSFDPHISLPESFLRNLHLALIYGLLVDLGYRKPKYEQKI